MLQINNIITDFKKIFMGYGFYTGVILTFLLCIFAPIYFDSSASENYTTIRCIFEFDKTFLLSDTSFSAYNVAAKGCEGFLTMFAPIISAFAFVPIVCDEYNSGNIRFNILRSTKTKYYLSKFLSSSICGGFILLTGFLLYTVFSYCFFPNISNYSAELRTIFEDGIINIYSNFEKFGYVYLIFRKSIEVFFYGFMVSIPSIILTNIIRNKYLIICIPFFVKYVTVQTCSKLSVISLEASANTDTFFSKIAKIINPDSLLNISIFPDVEVHIIIFNLLLCLIGLISFLIIAGVKYDCGE